MARKSRHPHLPVRRYATVDAHPTGAFLHELPWEQPGTAELTPEIHSFDTPVLAAPATGAVGFPIFVLQAHPAVAPDLAAQSPEHGAKRAPLT